MMYDRLGAANGQVLLGPDGAVNDRAERGSLLWIGGWSMSSMVWDKLKAQLQDFSHMTVQFEHVKESGDFVRLTRSLTPNFDPPSDSGPLSKSRPAFNSGPASNAPRRPLIAVGWSLGGMVAQRLASEGRVDGLVLIGSTARFIRDTASGNPGWPERHVRQMEEALTDAEQRNDVLNQFNRLLFTAEERAEAADGVWPSACGWTQEALTAGIRYLLEEDTRSLLAGLPCPVLIVHGSADAICPWEAAEYLHKTISVSSCMRIDNAGHVPFLGRERDIAAAIRRMSDELAQNASRASF